MSHTQYGTGTVIEAGARYITVAFDDGGVRKFVTALVQLEHSDLPPPVRPQPAARRRREAARLAVAKRNGR